MLALHLLAPVDVRVDLQDRDRRPAGVRLQHRDRHGVVAAEHQRHDAAVEQRADGRRRIRSRLGGVVGLVVSTSPQSTAVSPPAPKIGPPRSKSMCARFAAYGAAPARIAAGPLRQYAPTAAYGVAEAAPMIAAEPVAACDRGGRQAHERARVDGAEHRADSGGTRASRHHRGSCAAMARLIDPADSVLIVIDVQPDFLARVQPELNDGLIERIAFLAGTARHVGIPVIATVESPEQWGESAPRPGTAPGRRAGAAEGGVRPRRRPGRAADRRGDRPPHGRPHRTRDRRLRRPLGADPCSTAAGASSASATPSPRPAPHTRPGSSACARPASACCARSRCTTVAADARRPRAPSARRIPR